MNIYKIDWQKAVGRKADLQKAIQFSCNGAGGFGRFFDISDLTHQLYYFNGRITSIYFSEKEYSEFIQKAHDKLEDIDFVRKSENEILDICKHTTYRAELLSKSINPNSNKDNAYLLEIFKEFDDIWNTFYPVGWAFFFIAGFESKIEQKLLNNGFNSETAKEIIKIAAKPDRLTPVMEAEVGILRLAKVLDNSSANKEAKKLSKKYGWMSVYNTEDKERKADYYLDEARKIVTSGVDIDAKLNLFEVEIKNNEKAFKNYLKKIKDPLLVEQLKFLHVSGYLRDKREETRDRITILERGLYKNIGKIAGISEDNIVYLTNDEIISIFSGKNKVNLAETAQKRREHYVFTVDHGTLNVIDDENKIILIKNLFEVKEDIREIKGQIASRQKEKVRGVAKIVLSNQELKKINEGDILVATMTKPDFLVAMKKAAAFVTDEGGITCHAAIVAREMKKPCVIGTKVATQVLKDGDMVEVDAEKGIVKIIK